MSNTSADTPVDRIADVWGPRTPHPRGTVWPARVDLHLEPGVGETPRQPAAHTRSDRMLDLASGVRQAGVREERRA